MIAGKFLSSSLFISLVSVFSLALAVETSEDEPSSSYKLGQCSGFFACCWKCERDEVEPKDIIECGQCCCFSTVGSGGFVGWSLITMGATKASVLLGCLFCSPLLCMCSSAVAVCGCRQCFCINREDFDNGSKDGHTFDPSKRKVAKFLLDAQNFLNCFFCGSSCWSSPGRDCFHPKI